MPTYVQRNGGMGPSGVSALGWPPGKNETVDFVLDSVKRLAPDVHRELWWKANRRNVPTILAKYNIDSKPLAYQVQVNPTNLYGESRPQCEAELRWLEENQWNLPDPSHEPIEAWLQRARALYVERQKIEQVGRLPRPRWREFAKHCDWFVEQQVLGRAPLQIAKGSECTRAAVVRAVAKISHLLELPPVHRTRGRPHKM